MDADNGDRQSAAHLSAAEFRQHGHALVDALADLMEGRAQRPARPPVSVGWLEEQFLDARCPQDAKPLQSVFEETLAFLGEHSVSTSHPKFWAYIMGAASPIGALADFIASVASAPMTSFSTSPLTVAMEAQTVRWLANMLGMPDSTVGLFLSGGSVANLSAVQLALSEKCRSMGRESTADRSDFVIYVSALAHSSIQAAVETMGFAASALSVIELNASGRMCTDALKRQIRRDRQQGRVPFMTVAMAGSTAFGRVEPLADIAAICREESVWLHVDGAYGAMAVISDHAPQALAGITLADSVTVDPHKWMYMPADVGCLLTRHTNSLLRAFHQDGNYYSKDPAENALGGAARLQFRDLGPQTTRGFRALKVRIALQAIGVTGYKRLITEDIQLAFELYRAAQSEPLIEAYSCHLSITTLRFHPFQNKTDRLVSDNLLSRLNRIILQRIHKEGVFFPSHVMDRNVFLLRVCIVNLNTERQHVLDFLKSVVRVGQQILAEKSHTKASSQSMNSNVGDVEV